MKQSQFNTDPSIWTIFREQLKYGLFQPYTFVSKAAVSETDRSLAKTTTSLTADDISYYWWQSAEDELRGLTV